jgi:hypothetical protein
MEAACAMAQRLLLGDTALVLSRPRHDCSAQSAGTPGSNGFFDKSTQFESLFTPIQQHMSQKGLAP